MIGEKVSSWKITDLIDDSGGNGTVWRATDEAGSCAAIKVLNAFDNAEKSERRRRRFRNEIDKLELISKLGITGVMPILASGVLENGRPWFAMPLAEKLVPQPDRVAWAFETVAEVARTVCELHRNGLVHRDLKPNNLLLLEGKLLVADFGLARVADDERFTITGEAVGSYGYVAPECVGHSDEPQFKCDVYALAKTMWVLLTGARVPPTGTLVLPADSLARLGLTADAIDIAALDKFLVVATSRDPGDRPTARQFLDAIEALRLPKAASTVGTASPIDRAKSLFADQAAKNRRERECSQLYASFQSHLSECFFKSWGKLVVDALGWSLVRCNGGRMGQHTKQFRAPWRCGPRHFLRGHIDGIRFEIVLTCRRLETPGEPRLVLGATIAIQLGGRRPGLAEDEFVLAEIERDTFVAGPTVDVIRNELGAFASNVETQFRAIEKLKLLVNEMGTA